jgi:hypothetical protein
MEVVPGTVWSRQSIPYRKNESCLLFPLDSLWDHLVARDALALKVFVGYNPSRLGHHQGMSTPDVLESQVIAQPMTVLELEWLRR